jgi:hypothetical protein
VVGREVVRIDLVVRLGRVARRGLVVRDEVRARNRLGLVRGGVLGRVVALGDPVGRRAVEKRVADREHGKNHRRDEEQRAAGDDRGEREDQKERDDGADLPFGHVPRIPDPTHLAPVGCHAMIYVTPT